MSIASINPASGRTLQTFEPMSDPDVDHRLEVASSAFATFRTTPIRYRAHLLSSVADLFEAEVDSIAAVATTEMGKTLESARAEVRKAASGCRYYAEHGTHLLADDHFHAHRVGAARAYGRYEPLGPVLAVMPWNFPVWQVVRVAAPVLIAGNVFLLKHAPNVPQTALLLEECFERAGCPPGTFQTLLLESSGVERVLRDRRVRAATLTGSERAGSAIAAVAGSEIKPTVLELGGSDPFIVMPSADIEIAAAKAVTARCQNNGQSCIAGKRFLIHRDVADEFERRFVAQMATLRVGDPMDPTTDVGPLATEQGRQTIAAQVDDAVEHGAEVRCGGAPLDGEGWFYPPTVVTGITAGMRMSVEEVFGPVAQIERFDDLATAITLANSTRFGLGASVWTREAREQEDLIRGLESGAVFVNGITASYPELPFGGTKASGIGRELGAHGIRSFCNLKTVWVAP